MRRFFNSFFRIGGNLYPLVLLDENNSLLNNMPLIYRENMNLVEQVGVVANILKREDHIKLILAKQKIDNSNEILNLARIFGYEDMEVIGVYCEEMSNEAYEVLSRELKYGAVEGPVYHIGLPKTYKKTMH